MVAFYRFRDKSPECDWRQRCWTERVYGMRRLGLYMNIFIVIIIILSLLKAGRIVKISPFHSLLQFLIRCIRICSLCWSAHPRLNGLPHPVQVRPPSHKINNDKWHRVQSDCFERYSHLFRVYITKALTAYGEGDGMRSISFNSLLFHD